VGDYTALERLLACPDSGRHIWIKPVANNIALAAFLCILLIDIRLMQTIIPFPIGAAILIGCTINAMGLIVILLGFEQVL